MTTEAGVVPEHAGVIPGDARVVLEHGSRSTFAVALDWPGWARLARTVEGALDALRAYSPRYAPVAGPGFPPGGLRVVGALDGGSGTDFGVLAGPGPWDDEPLAPPEAERLTALLERS